MKKILVMLVSIGVLLNASTFTAKAATTQSEIKCDYKDEQVIKESLTNIGNGITLNSREIGSGYATVVFESGYSDGNDNYLALQKEIAKYTRTISYERAGIGGSSNVGNMNPLSQRDRDVLFNGGIIDYNKDEFTGLTKTPRDKAINLHNLLKAKNIPAPYVIVGHSLGGHTAIEFAKLYKDELAGVVFIDSSARNVTGQGYQFFKENMPDIADLYLQSFSTVDGTLDETLMGENQVKHDENALRDIPILYLESDQGALFGGEIGEAWTKLRTPQVKDILSLSDYSDYKLIEGSSHYVHLDKPEETKNEVMNFVYKVEYMK